MTAQMQNPGGQAGASRNQLGGSLRPPSTASDWRAQMLVARFCLSPWVAENMARFCFGEGCNE